MTIPREVHDMDMGVIRHTFCHVVATKVGDIPKAAVANGMVMGTHPARYTSFEATGHAICDECGEIIERKDTDETL